jgi:hypothetical protein
VVLYPNGPHRSVVDEDGVEPAVLPRIAEHVDFADLDFFAISQPIEGNEDIVLRNVGDHNALVPYPSIDDPRFAEIPARVGDRIAPILDADYLFLGRWARSPQPARPAFSRESAITRLTIGGNVRAR